MEAEEWWKMGKGWEHLHVSHEWCQVDARGGGVEFLTGEKEHSYECLRSFLVTDGSMKCSTFYECGPLPSPPTSTSCPPDIIHMVSVPRFPPFFTTPCSRVLYWMYTKEQKQGRLGNEARLIVNCYTIAVCIVQPYILYCILSQQAASVTDRLSWIRP